MYEFNTSLSGNYDEVLEKVRAVLMEEQLGIVSEVDVQAVFKAKMEKDIPPYRILGACNPKLADKVLADEPNAGTLLPCNLIVREESPGTVVVSFMDPETVMNLTDSDAAKEVGKLAKEKLERVVEKLNG